MRILMAILYDVIAIVILYQSFIDATTILNYIGWIVLSIVLLFIHSLVWNSSIMCKIFGHLDNGSDRCARCEYPLRRK